MKPVRQAAQIQRARVVRAGRGEVLGAVGASVEPDQIVAQHAQETVRAGMRGQITEVLPERGVVISGAATVIAGMVGFGAEAIGPIAFAQAATGQQHGALLVVPTELTQGIYAAARTDGVAGIIAASARPGLIAAIAGIPYSSLLDGAETATLPIPIMLAHGFGTAPLRPEVLQALGAYYRQPAWLNPATNIRTGQRPELVIPVNAGVATTAEERATLVPGAPVWIVAGRFTGSGGRITRIMATRQTLPSGVRVRAACVHLEQGSEAIIPLAHLLVAG